MILLVIFIDISWQVKIKFESLKAKETLKKEKNDYLAFNTVLIFGMANKCEIFPDLLCLNVFIADTVSCNRWTAAVLQYEKETKLIKS